MESWFLDDLIGPKSEIKPILGDAIYDKVKEAILENYKKIEIFTLLSRNADDTTVTGVIFSLDSEQFSIFLDSYLKICESREEYEKCREILDLSELA